MYAFVQGKKFTPADVPERTCSQARKGRSSGSRRRKEEADKPKTVNKAALAKKIKAQLDGIDLLEKLTLDLVRLGIGNMNAKTAREMEEQAKQLGNAYLPGARPRCTTTRSCSTTRTAKSGRPARARSDLQRGPRPARPPARPGQAGAGVPDEPAGRPRTQARKRTRASPPGSGHAWQLRELKDAGLVENNVELVQLAFNSHDDVARQEFVDTGVWMNLDQRPHPDHADVPPLQGRQVHQERRQLLPSGAGEGAVRLSGRRQPADSLGRDGPPAAGAQGPGTRSAATGQSDFAAAVKDVKTHLKGPLGRQAADLRLELPPDRSDRSGRCVVEDAKGERLVMTDAGMTEEPRELPSACRCCRRSLRRPDADRPLPARPRHAQAAGQAAEHRHQTASFD